MRSFKLTILAVFAVLSVFCVVFYASCAKDGCKGVTCMNNRPCSGGICSCQPDSGIGGNNCEIVYRNLYSNAYVGNASDDSGNVFIGSKLIFDAGNPPDTTNYNKMDLRWVDPVAGRTISFSNGIVLSNNLSTGSNFTVDTVTIDTVTYSGTGTVNGNTASLSLKEVFPHSPARIVSFNNFNKQ